MKAKFYFPPSNSKLWGMINTELENENWLSNFYNITKKDTALTNQEQRETKRSIKIKVF